MDQEPQRPRRRRRSALGLHPEHARSFLFSAAMAGVDLTQVPTETDDQVVRLAEGLFASLDLDTPIMLTVVH